MPHSMGLQLGDRVEVVGLVSDTGQQLNGQMGKIIVQLTHRWGVKLDSGVQKSIKTEHLKIVSACAICLEPLVTHMQGLLTFKCGHRLHEKCMFDLRHRNQSTHCPVCRNDDSHVTEQLYAQACEQAKLQNYDAVLRLLSEIVDIDPEHAEAHGFLGTIYNGTPYMPPDYEKSFAHLEIAYKQGCADAGHLLGCLYRDGQGTPQNFGRALELFEEAHRKGYAQGTYNLAVMHAAGQGTPQDCGKAKQFLEEAHQRGFARASFHLGSMYVRGDGVPACKETAIMYFEAASIRGDTEAAHVLSLLRGD